MKNSRRVVRLCVCVLLLAGSGGGCGESPSATTSPASSGPGGSTTSTTTPGSAEPGNDWPPHEAKAFGFSIRMPKAPKQQAVENGTQFVVEVPPGAYAVAVFEQPDRGKSTPQAYLDEMQGTLFDAGEKISRERSFELEGAEAAKEAVATNAEGNVYVVRFVLTPRRLYQILYVGPKDRAEAPETKRFLESFQLIKL